MKKTKENYLSFEVDKLTKSIENAITGDSFQTEVTNLLKSDLVHVSKKKGWLFDWKKEWSYTDLEVYKLNIIGNPGVIQGVISLKIQSDHIYMSLIESAPFNRGKDKIYLGVSGNLVAYACRLSFQKGYQGGVAFLSKTRLVDHYKKTLGAINVGGQLMVIETAAAKKLVEKYFKE